MFLNKSFQIRFTERVPTNYKSFINTRGNHVAARANRSAGTRGKEYGGYLMDIIIPYYYMKQNGRSAGYGKNGNFTVVGSVLTVICLNIFAFKNSLKTSKTKFKKLNTIL